MVKPFQVVQTACDFFYFRLQRCSLHRKLINKSRGRWLMCMCIVSTGVLPHENENCEQSCTMWDGLNVENVWATFSCHFLKMDFSDGIGACASDISELFNGFVCVFVFIPFLKNFVRVQQSFFFWKIALQIYNAHKIQCFLKYFWK